MAVLFFYHHSPCPESCHILQQVYFSSLEVKILCR